MLRWVMAFVTLFSLDIAAAQPWSPDRPVTILNPYAAGSTTDQLARALAAGMARRVALAPRKQRAPHPMGITCFSPLP